jgi:hypothetical protein
MKDLEIDRRLALAIGYAPEDVSDSHFGCDEVIRVRRPGCWLVFDHRRADVIYPIAEHYKLMPRWSKVFGCWATYDEHGVPEIVQTDPRTCIAIAVIEAADRGLLK